MNPPRSGFAAPRVDPEGPPLGPGGAASGPAKPAPRRPLGKHARILAAFALVFAAHAHAHKPSDSYLAVDVARQGLTGQWDIALRDLDFALGLDADGNGEITWGEVRARHADIAAYAGARLVVTADDQPCTLAVGEQLIDRHTDGAYAVLPLTLGCEAKQPQRIALAYTLFADLDPQHRGLLKLSAHGATRTAVLGTQAAPVAFELGAVDRWAAFTDYLREGVWHIWIGLDHILFLLSLLLPSVLLWSAAARWQPAGRARDAFWDVLRIVTAFTVAHSITLSLAVLGVIELPSRLVESVIALSVVVAALNNLKPLVTRRLWMVAFGFGLVHGFGFATVLADLGLPREALALALVGFNLGVEVGQLALVLAFLPLAFALRRTVFYRRWVMVGGSLVIAALAATWFAERAFEVRLLGL
ncbi:MAG TPA: HupE/UreJ family protein [Burkholderiaceae bacterium]|nr:HupE/UreJ family protein [Burkholderiaceae bacterium]